MVQVGGHDSAELVAGQRRDEVEDRRSGTRGRALFVTRMWNIKGLSPPFRLLTLVLQPQKQPQDLHPGECVRFRQAEALQAAVDSQLDIFGNGPHVVFPALLL